MTTPSTTPGQDRRHWLLLPPLVFCCCDVALTLAGQSPAYWDGEYAAAVEWNPLAAPFLCWHPVAFVAVATLWAGCFSLAILFLPRRWAVVVSVAVGLGHLFGAASWIVGHSLPGVGLVLVGGKWLLEYCWATANRQA